MLLLSAFTSRVSSAIQWQCYQLSAIDAAHPQLGLWAAADNMFATKARVNCCKAPLLLTKCTVALTGSEVT